MRLIDADALERDGWQMSRTVRINKDTMELQTRKPTDFDAADDIKRQEGHWILHYDEMMLSDGTSISGVECSKCGWKKYDKIYRLIACPYNFCPNCGADMKEEEQNENI